MAAKKKAKGWSIAPGKCKIVPGRVTICRNRNGTVTVKGASVKAVSKKTGKKKAAAKKTKGVKTKTGKVLKKTKGAPTSKGAKKAPRTKKSLSQRISACKSPLFNNIKRGQKANCSCVTVNTSNNLQVQKLKDGPCSGAVHKTGSDALRAAKAGTFLKTKRTAPKSSDVGIQWSKKKRKSRKKKSGGIQWSKKKSRGGFKPRW